MNTQPAPLDALPMPAAAVDHMTIAAAAAQRLRAANEGLFNEWEDLHPLDLLISSRGELEAFMKKAQSTAEADYMAGFCHAVLLLRAQLAAVTGRPFH